MTEEGTGWRPEEGETIKGRIIDLSRAWSDQGAGSWYPLVTIKAEDGKVTNIHCFHHTLRTRLLDRQPKIGDRLEITYHGKRETKDGKRTVAVYSIETPDTQIDTGAFWQGMGAAATAPIVRPAEDMALRPEDQMEIPEIADDDIPF